jgi:hypothetical protein
VEMADLFNAFRNMSNYISELYKKQAQLMKSKFGGFLKYYKEDMQPLIDVNYKWKIF